MWRSLANRGNFWTVDHPVLSDDTNAYRDTNAGSLWRAADQFRRAWDHSPLNDADEPGRPRLRLEEREQTLHRDLYRAGVNDFDRGLFRRLADLIGCGPIAL